MSGKLSRTVLRRERRSNPPDPADTLKNAWDVEIAERGLIKASEVRQTTVQALVDTGSTELVISDAIRRKLGLRIVRDCIMELANSQSEACQETGAVEIYWKDRETSCRAVVMPGQGEVLLGAIPMEALDLTVNPLRQEVTGAHGNKKLFKAK
jgi:clan AA aspartic protease